MTADLSLVARAEAKVRSPGDLVRQEKVGGIGKEISVGEIRRMTGILQTTLVPPHHIGCTSPDDELPKIPAGLSWYRSILPAGCQILRNLIPPQDVRLGAGRQ